MRGERRRPTPHLGAKLHARNRYKDNAPDFYALGQHYPSFLQYLRNVDHENKTAALSFDDPYAVRELTKTLLKHDFGLDWTIPIDRLCPPLPNRLNYLHWIEDLLHESGINPFDSSMKICGIDIGTGANCIYALLGAKMNGWHFIASEIDEISHSSALTNVARNDLTSLIHVQRVTTSQLLLEPLRAAPDRLRNAQFHFSMCNPPFFSDMSEADTNPDTSCMGNTSEMVCPGGEVAFIEHMIDDSLELRNRVLLYTSMIGRRASLRRVLALLRDKNISNVCSTEFFQGRTKRWGVAWTFAEHINLHSHTKVLGKRKEASRRREMEFTVPVWSPEHDHGCHSLKEVIARVTEFASSWKDHDVELELIDKETNLFFMRTLDKEPAEDLRSVVFGATVEFEATEGGDEDPGYVVTVEFETGKRDECWRLFDALKSATVRSGRQWRRKRNKSERPASQ